MQLALPHISFSDIEAIIPTAVWIAWSAVSGWQMIVTKIQRPKCIICGGRVSHQDQAESMPVACHNRCHYMAGVIGRKDVAA